LTDREHPAEDVYVTGTFDNWTKSEKLEKKDDIFEKTVALPDASEKIYYKVRQQFPITLFRSGNESGTLPKRDPFGVCTWQLSVIIPMFDRSLASCIVFCFHL
jgi:Glycogen recognition site of AMP-activated protein kinase